MTSTASKKSTADLASRGPFSDLTFAIAHADSRALEKQIRKSLQLDLGLSDALPPASAEPVQSQTRSKRVTWMCRSCFGKDANRHFDECYSWRCDQCGEYLTKPEVEQLTRQLGTPTPAVDFHANLTHHFHLDLTHPGL